MHLDSWNRYLHTTSTAYELSSMMGTRVIRSKMPWRRIRLRWAIFSSESAAKCTCFLHGLCELVARLKMNTISKKFYLGQCYLLSVWQRHNCHLTDFFRLSFFDFQNLCKRLTWKWVTCRYCLYCLPTDFIPFFPFKFKLGFLYIFFELGIFKTWHR